MVKQKYKYPIFLFFILMLISFNNLASSIPLAPDKAFMFSPHIENNKKINAEWIIAPGYYLYVDKFKFTFLPQITFNAKYPLAKTKSDNRGSYQVYSGHTIIPISLNSSAENVQMTVTYQGCSAAGFCYPPMKQQWAINFATGSVNKIVNNAPKVNNELTALLTDHNGVANLFYSMSTGWLLLIFFSMGLLLAFTPCVWPMIPIMTSIVVGQKRSSAVRAFWLSFTYVLGSALVYAIAGIIAASMGSSLQAFLQKPLIIAVTGFIFILLSLSLFNLYELRMPNSLQNKIVSLSNRQQGGNYLGVLMMGMLSTLIVSPCVTAPLVGVLMYIGQTGDQLLGASALFIMGLGMGVPLILIGTSMGRWLPKSGPWMEAIKKCFGFLMLAMAIWLLSRILPAIATTILWGILLISFSMFLLTILPQRRGQRMINRGISLIAAFSGVLIVAGGVGLPNKMSDWITSRYVLRNDSFVVVRSLTEIDHELSRARMEKRPVLLDFYADWCESCVTMDKHVFENADVKKALSNYILLRADLSANNAQDEAMLKHYEVIAPPTVLFFNNQGSALPADRIVGDMEAKDFLNHLDNIK